MKKRISVLITAAACLIGINLTSCATAQREVTVHLHSSFNPKEVAWFKKKGNNTLTGQAFLRTMGGQVITCAGQDVYLIPVSKYSSERIKAIYGNTTKAFVDILSYRNKNIKFIPDSKEYFKFIKKTICDANGRFKFTNLPDGEYFLFTQVVWTVPVLGPQGGVLMQKVRLSGGEKREVILTY
ncbi:hypothetical protein [Thermovibrio ammonificans]